MACLTLWSASGIKLSMNLVSVPLAYAFKAFALLGSPPSVGCCAGRTGSIGHARFGRPGARSNLLSKLANLCPRFASAFALRSAPARTEVRDSGERQNSTRTSRLNRLGRAAIPKRSDVRLDCCSRLLAAPGAAQWAKLATARRLPKHKVSDARPSRFEPGSNLSSALSNNMSEKD